MIYLQLERQIVDRWAEELKSYLSPLDVQEFDWLLTSVVSGRTDSVELKHFALAHTRSVDFDDIRWTVQQLREAVYSLNTQERNAYWQATGRQAAGVRFADPVLEEWNEEEDGE